MGDSYKDIAVARRSPASPRFCGSDLVVYGENLYTHPAKVDSGSEREELTRWPLDQSVKRVGTLSENSYFHIFFTLWLMGA